MESLAANAAEAAPQIQISAKITDGVRTGKGSSAHVTYNIVTTVRSDQGPPRQYRISRRYSHFAVLHDELTNILSENRSGSRSLPSLPKKTLTKQLGRGFINKRLQHLQEYLNAVVAQRTAATQKVVYSFLGASEISSLDRYAVDSWMMRTGGTGQLMSPDS